MQLPGSRSAALRSQRPRPRWRREPPWNAERKGRKKGEKGRRRGQSSPPQPAHLLRRPSGPSRGAAGPHAGDAAGERRRGPATAGGGGQRVQPGPGGGGRGSGAEGRHREPPPPAGQPSPFRPGMLGDRGRGESRPARERCGSPAPPAREELEPGCREGSTESGG